jgi:alpha-glucosidase
VATRWALGDPQRVRQNLSLLACLRGTVFIYQGEELGLPQAEVAFEDLQDPFGKAHWPRDKGRDGCRTPMPWQAGDAQLGFTRGKPWLPVSESHRALAVDVQETDADSTLHFTRRLLALRREHAALRTGAFEALHTSGKLLVLRRHGAGDQVWAAFNFGAEPVTHERPAAPVAASDLLAVGHARLDGRSLHLGPWSALIRVEASA